MASRMSLEEASGWDCVFYGGRPIRLVVVITCVTLLVPVDAVHPSKRKRLQTMVPMSFKQVHSHKYTYKTQT